MILRKFDDGFSGYKVIIQREPEILEFNTFEEAEAKMKELYEQYGSNDTKYYMRDCTSNTFRPKYYCDKDGNVVKQDICR